jgi:hypothetical protein
MILRAGAAVSEADAHMHEVRQELRAAGLHGLDLDHAVSLGWEIFRLAVAGRPIADTDRLVAPYLDTSWYRTAFGDGPISKRWSARWWRWTGVNFPVTASPYLEQFEGPVLWFLAEADENVPYVANRAALERAFARSAGTVHELVTIPGAKHSFTVADDPGPPMFTDRFFSRMGLWMAEVGASNPGCWALQK